MTILKTLNKLSIDLSRDFSEINRGGCCVVAGRVADNLYAHANNVEIRVHSYSDLSVDEARELSGNSLCNSEWGAIGFTFGHVIVTFDIGYEKYMFDTRKGAVLLSTFPDRLVDGSLGINEAICLGDNSGSWSILFDRDQIPEIVMAIDEAFNVYDIQKVA